MFRTSFCRTGWGWFVSGELKLEHLFALLDSCGKPPEDVFVQDESMSSLYNAQEIAKHFVGESRDYRGR